MKRLLLLILFIISYKAGFCDNKLKTVSISNFDFTYKQDVCDPFTIQFFNVGSAPINPYWSFGDGVFSTSNNPVHKYSSAGNYTVKYSIQNSGFPDTITKIVSVAIIYGDIIMTPDTILCSLTSKQLNTVPSPLSFCWNPTTYLNDPGSPNPIANPPSNITYFFNAEITGANLILNGDFNAGNTGFSSQYHFTSANTTEGEYFVGISPKSWNVSLSDCGDHSSGSTNMLLVNGASTTDINVWKETVAITPNTNYAFSTWVEALYPPNPAQLQFSINGSDVGSLITASLPTCTWTQFYTTWNSGNMTSATISILNKNTQIQGNDFALDDISFAPVFIKRDSVKIIVDITKVKTNTDVTVCTGSQIQLNSTGANTYTWSPKEGLSNSTIANPLATISNNIIYFVTGTSVNGCISKDTVAVSTFIKPLITITPDSIICRNTSIQLLITGGNSYSWSPAGSLNNPNISDPVATPTSATTYIATVTDSHTCSYKDSVKVNLKPVPVFTVSPPQNVCSKESKQLMATGGNSYFWQPSDFLNQVNIKDPISSPDETISYVVKIKDSTCNDSATLTTTLTVLPLPEVRAGKTNDIDCSNNFSQLIATGARYYTWFPGKDLNDSTLSNPLARPSMTTLYSVHGIDDNGCSNTDTVTVNFDISSKNGYYMPNAFTPNGDGLNDCFGIKSLGAIELEFSIYNRLGERVFHTTDPAKCWDGTYKGRLQDANVFVYIIKAKTLCDTINKKGYIVLLK